ncbi:MAG: hypothetical protein AAGF32_07790, partial [Pseudomonadota bacterium]
AERGSVFEVSGMLTGGGVGGAAAYCASGVVILGKSSVTVADIALSGGVGMASVGAVTLAGAGLNRLRAGRARTEMNQKTLRSRFAAWAKCA